MSVSVQPVTVHASARIERLECRFVLDALPAGAEFRVNTYTTGGQDAASVAMDAMGNFAVVWQSDGQDGSGHGVYAQRFDRFGLPRGDEFRVNTTTVNGQRAPAVAMHPDGHFVVTWTGGFPSTEDIFARLYSAAGAPLGGELLVNTFTWDAQTAPSVDMADNGEFVITWESAREFSGDEVKARRFSAAGVPHGDDFRVNTFTTADQQRPTVAMDAAGNFVVAWESRIQGTRGGIYAQRYNASGVTLGGEVRVNSSDDSFEWVPAADMAPTGEFVVTWVADLKDGSETGVFAQRYTAAGVPDGAEFLVNVQTLNHQSDPDVAIRPDGSVTVVWRGNVLVPLWSTEIFARHYDAEGAPLGGEVRVNTQTADLQFGPRIATDADGDFVVTWVSSGQDGSGYGIYAQRYARAPSVTSSIFHFDTAPHRLAFTFDQDVSASLSLDDLVVQAQPGGAVVTPVALTYDAPTNTATVTFDGILADGDYRATLNGAGVTNALGTPLGTDHVLSFFFLTGDANHDRAVNLADFNVLASNFGQSPRDFTQGDFNYDGTVNLSDFNILAARFGQALGAASAAPARTPVAGGGTKTGGALTDRGDDPLDELLA